MPIFRSEKTHKKQLKRYSDKGKRLYGQHEKVYTLDIIFFVQKAIYTSNAAKNRRNVCANPAQRINLQNAANTQNNHSLYNQ